VDLHALLRAMRARQTYLAGLGSCSTVRYRGRPRMGAWR
jgi:hypothetical protein